MTAPTSAQITRDGGEEDARLEDGHAVGHDRGDGPGHVPRADQGTHGQQDEDGAHGRRHPADGGITEAVGVVAVLHRHQPGEHPARHQRHLERAAGGVDPEQDDRQREEHHQHHDGCEGVQQARWTRLALGAGPRRRRARSVLPGLAGTLPTAAASFGIGRPAVDRRAHPAPRRAAPRWRARASTATTTWSGVCVRLRCASAIEALPSGSGTSCSARRLGPCRARSRRSRPPRRPPRASWRSCRCCARTPRRRRARGRRRCCRRPTARAPAGTRRRRSPPRGASARPAHRPPPPMKSGSSVTWKSPVLRAGSQADGSDACQPPSDRRSPCRGRAA